MSIEEKLLLIECILRDIRCDWNFNLKYRIHLALNIIEDIEKIKKINKLDVLKQRIEEFKEDIGKEWVDGRFFRREYPNGYECMNKIHTLSNDYKDKTKELKEYISKLNCPNMYLTNYY